MSEFRGSLEQEIPRLRRAARALAPDREAADDLVQEALLRALRDDGTAAPGSLRLRLLTHLLTADRNRRRTPGRRAGEQAVPAAPPPPGAVGALPRLSAEYREVIVLVVLERLSYLDCAEVLGVPVSIVMTRLARARGQMRELVEGVQVTSGASYLRIVK
jgi:RNA polymerase sigma-70 factor (ECF subfamily)